MRLSDRCGSPGFSIFRNLAGALASWRSGSARKPIAERESNERGAALVEFALIVAPLTLLLLSVFEWTLVAWVDHTVRLAAAEGARLAVFCNDAADADRRVKVTQKVTEVMESTVGRAKAESVQVEIQPPPPRGQPARVSVAYTFKLPVPALGGVPGVAGLSEVKLSAEAVAMADKNPGNARCEPPQ